MFDEKRSTDEPVKIQKKTFSDGFSCNHESDSIGFIKCRRVTVKIDMLKFKSGVLLEAKPEIRFLCYFALSRLCLCVVIFEFLFKYRIKDRSLKPSGFPASLST